MCLAIPGKLLEIFDENGLKMGNIDFAGSVSKACLEYVPEIEIGQYAIVHAGFALSVLNGEEDFIKLNGIDCWLGGVHLQGGDSRWRWDEQNGKLIESAG